MELYSKIIGSGEPLIIMHGVFGSGDNWATLGRKWSQNYQVHLLDMRNHGKSPHSEAFSYDLMADDLLAYIENQGLKNPLLLGHSMGGKVAMLFATLYPSQVKKLIVADIAPKPYKPHHQNIIDALLGLDLENVSSRSEAEEQFASFLKDEGTRMFLLKSLYWKEKGKLGWRFNVPVIAREVNRVGEALPANAIYNGPTLFARGGSSKYIKEDDEGLILEHFPNASIKTINNAGHWLHAEKPLEFYDMINEFLEEA